MEAIESILTRRSVRSFSSKEVDAADIEVLLRAAMQAPSSSNSQPWQFVVITDRPMLDAITEFHPFSGALKTAPLAILVCGDARLEVGTGRWIQSCCAATQNLLLAAHARGLGAVWLGIQPEEHRVQGLRHLLEFPSGVHPLALIAVGHPAGEAQPPASRYLPDRVHYNGWV